MHIFFIYFFIVTFIDCSIIYTAESKKQRHRPSPLLVSVVNPCDASPLSLNSGGSFGVSVTPKTQNVSPENDSRVATLREAITHLVVTPDSAYQLGCQLKDAKVSEEERIRLLEEFHNRVGRPLRGSFRNADGGLDKQAYNDFLEQSLPRINGQPQQTPLVPPVELSSESKKRGASVFEDR